MKKVELIMRIILGLIFFVFGLNGFFHFIDQPPLPEAAKGFMMGLGSSGYFFPFLKTTEVIMGALLLSGLYVRLALVVLAPVIINIFLFHLFLAPSGLPLAVLLIALEAFLIFVHRDKFSGVLKMKLY